MLTFSLKKVTRFLEFRVDVSRDGKSSERELLFYTVRYLWDSSYFLLRVLISTDTSKMDTATPSGLEC